MFANRSIGIGLLALLLAFLSVYPMGMLLYGSIHSTPPGVAGTFNLDGYRELISSNNLTILANTVGIALVKTGLSITLAVLLAWIVARTDTPWRGPLEILITLPFFIPPVLTAMAWGMLGNPQVGTINIVLKAVFGLKESPINVYSYGGVIWHMMQYSTTFLFLLIVDAFRAMDPALEEASRMSGAARWSTFRRVTLILMLPIVTSAFILSLMRAIEAFESPFFFGLPAGIEVLTTEIYNAINHRATPDYQYATALAIFALVLMFVVVVGQWKLLGNRSFQTVTGKGYSPNITKLGPWKYVTLGFCLLFFFITVILPVGQLILGSFFKFFGFYSWKMLTLEHYTAVMQNRTFWRGFLNTLMLALIGATVTMILGGLVAYITVRTKWRGRRLLDALAWLPWMMPGIVLGIGFLWAFAMLPGPIPIYGTVWALLLAYMALGTPLSVRVMSGIYAQLSYDLEECSRVHGATWFQTVTRILVALAWPAFAVGWVLTFFGVMRELSASVLLYSAGSEVLSVVMLGLWTEGKAEQVCVIGEIMLVLVLVFRWVQLRFIQRRISTL